MKISLRKLFCGSLNGLIHGNDDGAMECDHDRKRLDKKDNEEGQEKHYDNDEIHIQVVDKATSGSTT